MKCGGLFALIVIGMAAGCTNSASSTAADSRPAHLVGAQLSCIAEIREQIGQQTGRQISLTENAFANSDILLLEQATAIALDGRVRELPEHFQLRLQGDRCWLIRGQTGEHRPLHACQCELAAP